MSLMQSAERTCELWTVTGKLMIRQKRMASIGDPREDPKAKLLVRLDEARGMIERTVLA